MKINSGNGRKGEHTDNGEEMKGKDKSGQGLESG